MSDTPTTDAAKFETLYGDDNEAYSWREAVPAEVCRKLERERDEAREAVSDEQINIAIAEACGKVAIDKWGEHYPIPNYCNDLNAMHEAEKGLENPDLYEEWLESIRNGKSYLFHATARQRAEAFLRTIGKWKEAAK